MIVRVLAAVLIAAAPVPLRAQSDDAPPDSPERMITQDPNATDDGASESPAGGLPQPGGAPELPPRPGGRRGKKGKINGKGAGARKRPPFESPSGDPPSEENAEPSSSESARPAKYKAAPMNMVDAVDNFKTVVQTHMLQNSTDGSLVLKDKGETFTLEIERILDDTIHKTGAHKVTGCVAMREQKRGDHKVDADFTVDFSGEKWEVASVRIHKVDGKARSSVKEKLPKDKPRTPKARPKPKRARKPAPPAEGQASGQ
ncbi:MAG: hypothetical protein HY078_15935 [Elusimicrobia bacterium]|nr:hypothetical protein [Elusimicrobiota bacterium]